MSSEERHEQKKIIKLPLVGLKILELCLIVICIGLLDDPANNSRKQMFVAERTIQLSYATFGAFLIFTGVYLFTIVFKDLCSWKTSALMSLIGFILFLACGSMLFRDWSNVKKDNFWPPHTQRLDFVCGTASLAIITSLLFLCDLILTYRLGMRGEIE